MLYLEHCCDDLYKRRNKNASKLFRFILTLFLPPFPVSSAKMRQWTFRLAHRVPIGSRVCWVVSGDGGNLIVALPGERGVSRAVSFVTCAAFRCRHSRPWLLFRGVSPAPWDSVDRCAPVPALLPLRTHQSRGIPRTVCAGPEPCSCSVASLVAPTLVKLLARSLWSSG